VASLVTYKHYTIMKETAFDYVDENEYATFTTNEQKWIARINKLVSVHPGEVKVIHEPEDNRGYLVCHLPRKWMKISPPRKMNYSEEERRKMAERARARFAKHTPM